MIMMKMLMMIVIVHFIFLILFNKNWNLSSLLHGSTQARAQFSLVSQQWKVYNCVVTTCPCFYSHFAFLRNVLVTIVDFNNCYLLITTIFIIVC